MDFYGCNAIGFFLQAFPCILLSTAPFLPSQLPASRKSFFGFLFVSALAFSAAFPLFIANFWNKDEASQLHAANLYIAAVVLIYTVALTIRIRGALYHQMIVFGLVFNYGACVYMLVNFGLAFLPEWTHVYDNSVYQPIDLIFYAALAALSFVPVWRFLHRAVQDYFMDLKGNRVPHTTVPIPVLSILYSISIGSINSNKENMQDTFTLLAFLFCTICLVLAYWFLLCEIQSMRIRMEYDNQLKVFQIQYKKITADIEAGRRASHDLRQHFRLLRILLEEGKTQEAQSYLDRTERLYTHEEQQIYCKDPMLNALLQYYAGEAQQSGIIFHTFIAMGKCSIEMTDLTVLLGNCLENALESCKRTTADRSQITLKIKQVNHTLAIQMENTCEAVLSHSGKKHDFGSLNETQILSQKSDGVGIGLLSVKSIAKKYGGTAEYLYKPSCFVTKIALELPQEPRNESLEGSAAAAHNR